MTAFRDPEKESLAPSEELAAQIAARYLKGVVSACRTSEGVSTFVYRVKTEYGDRYIRFLPEDASFGAEVFAQKRLSEIGVLVPQVLCYESRERETGRSMMITDATRGKPLTTADPETILRPVLREAGRQLKLLHTIPVQGFGWIDRRFETQLRGEHANYQSYFNEFLEEDLHALAAYYPPGALTKLQALTEEARMLFDCPQAVLVHGDFCFEHIFHVGGTFTGLIDFGEIRGSHPLFDLGAFENADRTEGHAATRWLLEGYGTVDSRALHLSALCFILRFAGRKANLPAGEYWRAQLQRELALLQ